MKHRHFPRYNDDSDFTTNAPSYYEDLARKEKLIRLLAERIWGYEEILNETLEEIQERFRAWDKKLEDFPDDVKVLLQQWLDDGTLDHIINDTIFNWKLDTSIFEQFRDTITAQLQQTDYEAKRKRKLEDLDAEVLSAIEGGEGTSFNLLSIPQNYSVSEVKTTFIQTSPNLINPNNLDVGFLRIDVGEINPLAAYRYTKEPIAVSGSDRLYIRGHGASVINVIYRDSSGNFLSGDTNDSVETVTYFEVPPNAHFFQVSFRADVLENFMVTYDSYDGAYIPYFRPKLDPALLPTSNNSETTFVCFGDSIINNGNLNGTDITTYTEKATGLSGINVGFGGTQLTTHTGYWQYLSMHNLADAVVTRDFSNQDNAMIAYTGFPSDFPDTLSKLKAINFDLVEYITIAHGTNDFAFSKSIDNAIDKYDVLTIKGSLRYTVKRLLEKYPHLKILLMTPIYRTWLDTDNLTTLYDSDTHTVNGITLKDYVQAFKEVGEELKTPVLDNYSELGFNKYNLKHYFEKEDGTIDGTHPNVLGRKRMGEKLGSALISKF